MITFKYTYTHIHNKKTTSSKAVFVASGEMILLRYVIRSGPGLLLLLSFRYLNYIIFDK